MSSHPNRRTVRLIVHVPPTGGHLAHWCLIAESHSGRVPTAHIVERGLVPLPGPNPAEHEVWEALDRIVSAHVLT